MLRIYKRGWLEWLTTAIFSCKQGYMVMVNIKRDGGTNKFHVLDWRSVYDSGVLQGLSWKNGGIAITVDI